LGSPNRSRALLVVGLAGGGAREAAEEGAAPRRGPRWGRCWIGARRRERAAPCRSSQLGGRLRGRRGSRGQMQVLHAPPPPPSPREPRRRREHIPCSRPGPPRLRGRAARAARPPPSRGRDSRPGVGTGGRREVVGQALFWVRCWSSNVLGPCPLHCS
jgi:hypothetical protein